MNRTGLAEEFSLGFELGDRMREAVYINLGEGCGYVDVVLFLYNSGLFYLLRVC